MEGEDRLFFVIGVDVDPEVEDAFNEWYDTVHLPSVVACPGYVSGQRFRNDEPDGRPRYTAVYELENREAFDSPELNAIKGFHHFADRVSNVQRYWMRPMGPFVTHAEALAGAPERARG